MVLRENREGVERIDEGWEERVERRWKRMNVVDEVGQRLMKQEREGMGRGRGGDE
jgi:hypothetical protein